MKWATIRTKKYAQMSKMVSQHKKLMTSNKKIVLNWYLLFIINKRVLTVSFIIILAFINELRTGLTKGLFAVKSFYTQNPSENLPSK